VSVAERRGLADAEVVELLRDEPALLAIADAIATTQRPPQRRRRRVPARLLVAAAAVALVLVAGQVQPWERGGDAIAARALAAVGHGPVLHAAIETESETSAVVDLVTGAAVPVTVRIEQWFDDERRLLRSVVRRDGVVVGETLETPTGGTSTFGEIERPPGTRPALSPPLAEFVTGYREALEMGAAWEDGVGEIGGAPVRWLSFAVRGGSMRVAVEEASGRPLVLETGSPGAPPLRWRVVEIGTGERRDGQFAPPARGEVLPVRGDVRSSERVSAAALPPRLSWRALWLGPLFAGLPLEAVRLDELSEGYPPVSRRPPAHGEGVRLLYGDWRRSFVEVRQAPRPQMAYGLVGERTFDGGVLPPEGKVALLEQPGSGGSGWLAQLRRAGNYVALACSSRELCLEAARALRELPREGER
jgi:hypothetical protein